jgi:transcriptional regulator with XRE-family HTH domain
MKKESKFVRNTLISLTKKVDAYSVLTRKDISRKLKKNKSYISAILTRGNTPSLETIEAVANYIGYQPKIIFIKIRG